MTFVVLAASAQSGTNSPYSQYGFGVLADQTGGGNRGMNGLGVGYKEHNQVNFINPASYSSIDSLSFIFDVGVSGQLTNFSENGKKKNAKNADFEYAIAGFRVARGLGMSFGLLPFSNVGYSFSSTSSVNGDNTVASTQSYSGSGGLHQAFVGVGWSPLRNLSVGVNASYIWGSFTRSITNVYSEATISSLSKTYDATLTNYKIDLGVQYTVPLDKKNSLTVGATFSPGHNVGGDPSCRVTSYNTQTGVSNTSSYEVKDGLELPNMLSAGLMFNHNNQLKVGVDYHLQQWSKISFPIYQVNGNTPSYAMSGDYFNDRHKIVLGGEYCKAEMTRGFFNRLRYRAGVSYGTTNYKINGSDGPKEMSVSAGFGIPIVNTYNNRSILNLSAQWSRLSGNGLLAENTFRINLGITFNERWFMKWMVD